MTWQRRRERAAPFARYVPSLVGLATLAALTCLWFASSEIYTRLLRAWGIEPFPVPFLDLAGSLAAWDCSRKGIDVILSDPCDVLGRGYNYSPLWMSIDWIPLGLPDRIWVGVVLSVAFLVTLSALPPPRSLAETALRTLATLSTMVVFAIERCNPDILIFCLVMAMTGLLHRSPPARAIGYAVAFLAGAIKYYPFILLGLVVRERARFAWAVTLAACAAFFLFVWIYGAQIAVGLPHITQGSPFADLFGAKNLPIVGAALVIARAVPTLTEMQATGIAAFVTSVIFGWTFMRTGTLACSPSAINALDEKTRLPLLAGAVLLVGCFFTGQSIGYRGVLLLLLLPGLAALGRDHSAGPLARASRVAGIAIPVLMWAEGIRRWIHYLSIGDTNPFGGGDIVDHPLDLLVWLLRESAWWLLIGLLCTILIGFVATRLPASLLSPAAQPRLNRGVTGPAT